MIGNKRKTIGVLLESSLSEYANQVCQGLIQGAANEDYDILFFQSIGRYGNSNNHYVGEEKIYELPPYEDLDGVVVLLDTILVQSTCDKVVELVKTRCHCPVISIREKMEGMNNFIVDNKTCMCSIVEHFIDEHHFTRLSFMSGPKDRWDANERLDCFLEVMAERNLPVREHNIFYGDFWKNKTTEACDWFLSVGEMPEVIICANDHMASSLAKELLLRGYRIPDDICVSGYDGLKETLNYTPSITTVSVPFYEMGLGAVSIIREKSATPGLVNDYFYQVQLHPRESCGCHKYSDMEIILSRANWQQSLTQTKNRNSQFNLLSIQLGLSNTIESLPHNMGMYIGNIDNFKDYCMCLCENAFEREHSDDYTEKMEARIVFLDGKDRGPQCIPFSRKELLPPSILDDKPQAWYFAPLHFEDRLFGYEAIQFNRYDLHITGQLFPTWNILIGNKLQDISNHYEKQKLIDQLEYLYNRDALTGMYNRRGLLIFAPPMIEEAKEQKLPIFMAIIDLDGLKQINDHYGHIEGDHVLNVLYDAIRCSTPESAVSARTGGDEFVILLKGDAVSEGDTVLAKIQEYLDRLNESHVRPYAIHASTGSACRVPETDDTVETFISESDAIMYQNKVQNKLSRGEALR